MDFTLRPMTAGDLPRAKIIERASFATPWTDQQWEALANLEEVWGYMFHEADGTGDAFGCVFFSPSDTGGIYLLSLSLLPEKQGQGLGTRIMEEILDRERPRGVKGDQSTTVHLDVRVSNIAAQRMYHKLGFVVVGKQAGYYHDPAEDSLHMVRVLTPAEDGWGDADRVMPNPWALVVALCGQDPACEWPDQEYTAVQHTLATAGIPVDEVTTEMLCALQVVVTQPYQLLQNVNLLDKIIFTLNGHITDLSAQVAPPSLGEMCYGIDLITRLGVPFKEEGLLTHPARTYCEATLHHHGVSVGLGPLYGIIDRTQPALHRHAVLDRYLLYHQNRRAAVVDDLQENALDVEVAKLDTMIIYTGIQYPQEPFLARDMHTRLSTAIQKRIPS